MKKHVDATFTRSNGFLRAVIFLKEDKAYVDAHVSAIFCSGEKDHIFIPAPKENMTDPVYPEKCAGQFVYRIGNGIYCATLFGTKEELDRVTQLSVFAGGEEAGFDL